MPGFLDSLLAGLSGAGEGVAAVQQRRDVARSRAMDAMRAAQADLLSRDRLNLDRDELAHRIRMAAQPTPEALERIIGDDGEPVLVPRSRAVNRRPYVEPRPPEPPEPLHSVMTPDGPRLAPRSEALGKQPYEAPRQESAGTVIQGAEGGPMVVDTRKGTARPVTTATGDPVQMKPPTDIANGYNANAQIVRQIDDAIAELRSNPQSTGIRRAMPNVVNERLDPSGVSARASVSDVGSLKIHQRSGAAVSAKEEPRLMPFVPISTSPADVNITKLERLREFAVQENEAMAKLYPALTRMNVGKPSLAERVQQLKAQGLTKEQAQAKLVQEGYDLRVP